MSEPARSRGPAAPPLVHVPVDLVEFEARLGALERRLSDHEARDQLLLGVAEALRSLTEALRPLLDVIRPVVEEDRAGGPMRRRVPQAATGTPSPKTVDPERLAQAQARMRAVAVAPAAETASTSALPPANASTTSLPDESTPSLAPPGRRSWLRRALRRMVAQDPERAGRLLLALRPAHRLAGIEPVEQLPGPSAIVARVVVRGRLGRRLGWEMAQLDCELDAVSALARLVRLRASPAQLHAAGVRPDPPVALALVAAAADPLWTLGHSFTLAHRDVTDTYLEIRSGARPSVGTGPPARGVTTTVRCPADALLPLFAGAPGVAATVEGERRPFELVRGWFADATSA